MSTDLLVGRLDWTLGSMDMATISCRNCGQVREAYESSAWCVECVNVELALQRYEDEAPVEPQVFGVLESA